MSDNYPAGFTGYPEDPDGEAFEGLLPSIEKASLVKYDSTKGITIEELWKTAMALDEDQRLKVKNGWKPEYVLSKWEAENLELWQLTWLGENYRVLTSLEIANIVKQREDAAK